MSTAEEAAVATPPQKRKKRTTTWRMSPEDSGKDLVQVSRHESGKKWACEEKEETKGSPRHTYTPLLPPIR